MARYAIKHKPTRMILEIDYCNCMESGVLYNESDQFLTWGDKKEAEDALINLRNKKKPIYCFDSENETESEHPIDEFEIVEL